MKKEVYRSVKLTDNINVAQLSVADQLRLLVSKVSNNDEAELDANKKLNEARMKSVAALSRLFDTAIDKMNKLGENKVTLGVSSDLMPYLDDVIDERHGLGRFYDIEVEKRNLPVSIRHMVTVVVKKRIG